MLYLLKLYFFLRESIRTWLNHSKLDVIELVKIQELREKSGEKREERGKWKARSEDLRVGSTE